MSSDRSRVARRRRPAPLPRRLRLPVTPHRAGPTPPSPRAGFTLVELMVVVVIIGLLAGAVTFGVRGYLLSGKQNVAKLEIAKIGQALDTYYTLYDRYPGNEDGLAVLAEPTDRFPDGILDRLPRDPWGRDYQYVRPGRSGPYEVLCLGADGREGGTGADADLSSENLGPEAAR